MQRLALVLALCGCASAQRHPAIAIGIVGAVIGGLACEMNDPANQSTCAIIATAAGAGLGGITGLVTLFADTSDHTIAGDEDMEMEGSAVRLHTRTLPPPEPIVDAGAGSAVDATSPDAGVDAQGAPSSAR